MMPQCAIQKRLSNRGENALDHGRKFAGDRRSYLPNSLINRPILATTLRKRPCVFITIATPI